MPRIPQESVDVLMDAAEAGWSPPRCKTCGHPEGDHQSPRSMNSLASPPRGLCHYTGCDCTRYERAE